MALDDDVGRPVEAALAAAGARGVTVRVLVDSLHGLHGSFGLHNPTSRAALIARRAWSFASRKPITRESSLEDLKQRDHRKLVVVDGRVALLGGRNLSHEYYSGFDEVPLNPRMTWRMVPWLDAGARVEGPAVAALERSFLAGMDRCRRRRVRHPRVSRPAPRRRASSCIAACATPAPSKPTSP